MVNQFSTLAAGDLKILFAGSVGAGKTTAIRAISDTKTISTDVLMSEGATAEKTRTTVGFDYGECQIGDGHTLRLYGTPGQSRFRFMWDIVAKGALGLVVLADNTRPDPIGDVESYLQAFAPHLSQRSMVVGVGRLEERADLRVADYVERLAERGFHIPIVEVDVREADHVRLLLSILVSMAEVESE